MNGQERLRRVMHYQEVDRVPNIEVGTWSETLARWQGEGLAPDVPGCGHITFNGCLEWVLD